MSQSVTTTTTKSASEVQPSYFLANGMVGPDHIVSRTGVKLLGVGNPLLDMSANVPTSMLEKYHVKSGDVILAEDKHMGVYDELVASYKVDWIAGGATQNSMRVAAWMLKGSSKQTSENGESSEKTSNNLCAYAGCVGADAHAAKLKECAEAAAVTTAYQIDAATPTGLCACLIDDTNERTLITRLDAADNFKKFHLETEEVQKLVSAARVIYSAGFFLTSGGPDCTRLLGEHCVSYGKKYCLNLSAPFIPMFFTDALDATMPYVDILFGNETEAATLGEKKGWGTDVETVALKAAALPKASGTFARVVVFTQGANATVVATNNAVTTYPVPPVPKADIVDTNGAGDAMVGGFLSQLILGEPIQKCVDAGHFAAATIIKRSGCTMPDECAYAS